jgi:hypothetical protein
MIVGFEMIAGFDCVSLSMSVDERLRVIGVGLVDVLLGYHRGERKPRHQGKRDDPMHNRSDTTLTMHDR